MLQSVTEVMSSVSKEEPAVLGALDMREIFGQAKYLSHCIFCCLLMLLDDRLQILDALMQHHILMPAFRQRCLLSFLLFPVDIQVRLKLPAAGLKSRQVVFQVFDT